MTRAACVGPAPLRTTLLRMTSHRATTPLAAR